MQDADLQDREGDAREMLELIHGETAQFLGVPKSHIDLLTDLPPSCLAVGSSPGELARRLDDILMLSGQLFRAVQDDPSPVSVSSLHAKLLAIAESQVPDYVVKRAQFTAQIHVWLTGGDGEGTH